jgi:anti-anti-sigma factor
MELKRLSEDDGVLRLQSVDPIARADPGAGLREMEDSLGDQGYAGKVLLSLSETEFIDSSGLSWLLTCQKRFCEAGGRLVIHSIPSSVSDVLMMMRLELVLELAEDESAALELLRGDTP